MDLLIKVFGPVLVVLAISIGGFQYLMSYYVVPLEKKAIIDYSEMRKDYRNQIKDLKKD